MNAQIDLIEGTTRDLSKSQWFTPPELAQRVVEWAGIKCVFRDRGRDMIEPASMRVFEPSAGNGALVRPLLAAGAQVHAIELDERYIQELELLDPTNDTDRLNVWQANFLNCELIWKWDLCVMNPPYENGLDVAFILHALKFAPRVVGIFTDRILFGVERKEGLWSKVRPTRIAFQSRRPFKGAQTDYVVLELVACSPLTAEREGLPVRCMLEWW